jgi:hypothetical protein
MVKVLHNLETIVLALSPYLLRPNDASTKPSQMNAKDCREQLQTEGKA